MRILRAKEGEGMKLVVLRCARALAAFALAAALGLPPAPGPAVAADPAADAELEQLKREAAELIERLRRELEAAQAERERLEAERKALETTHPEAQPPEPVERAEAPEPKEVERQVGILAREVERLKERIVLPEVKEYKSYYGLGPAASKIYQVNRGLSIGGYGEANFKETVSDTAGSTDQADFLRFVLYTGYKFSERILFNAEIEFEHATSDSTVTSSDGSVSLELAYLDFLGSERFNARAGLVLIPLGFINEIHEPVFFFGNNRPEVERQIIPTTWRELGVGIFGSLHEDVQYRGYVTTTLNAKGFSASGIRGGRQKANRSLAENLGGSLRLDYTPRQLPGLLVGASAFLGNTGQNQNFAGEEVDAFLTLWDVHAQYRYRGLELRALAAFGTLDDVDALSRDLGEPIADRFEGWYAEIGYDVMPHLLPQHSQQYLAPFFRFEHIDPQASVGSGFSRDLTKDTDLYTVGVSYKPHPQVVLKADYRNFELRRGNRTDDVNLGLGFIF
jgi:hypothetical protein